MITGITLENFKGFHEVEFQPKQITAFVGPNGTGKSTVLQAFGLLKQSVEKLGEIPDPKAIGKAWELTWQGPLVNLRNSELSNLRRRSPHPTLSLEETSRGRAGRPSPPSYSYVAQFSGDGLVPKSMSGPAASRRIYRLIKSLKMVPAVRSLNQPVYKLGEEKAVDVSLETEADRQEAQLATNLGYSQPEIEKISSMLKKVTGSGLKAAIVPPQSVEITTLAPAGPVNILSEGFGTNSLIMLLLQLVSANRGATVMIEEPEIHLHPKAQADLAEVLATEALAGNKQVIMTTHSEHITGRLLTLVAERALTPEDLAIYAFEKNSETGVCTAKPLAISTDGGVEGGVRDFFATNLAEMNRFVEAQFAQDKEKSS